MIRTINLDAIDSVLSGQYNSGDIILVLCNASLESITTTLPDAKSLRDVLVCIKKTDTSDNTITFNTVDGQTIDGETSIVLEAQYESEIIISDLSNYYRFGNIRFI